MRRDSTVQPWDGVVTRAEPDRRDITCRAYALKSETWNEQERSVEAVIATENPALVFDMSTWRMIYEVLLMDGCKLPPSGQLPLLDTHDRSSIDKCKGSTRKLRIESGELVARNYFASDQASKDACDKVRDKHVTDNSIGYRVLQSVLVKAGTTAAVNGRNFTAPPDRDLRVTTQWQPVENSLCVIGADPNAKTRTEQDSQTGTPQSASTRAAASAHTPAHGPQDGEQGKEHHMPTFDAWLEKRGLKAADLSEATRAALKADYDAEAQRAAPPVPPNTPPAPAPAAPQASADPAAARTQAVAEERKRIADIGELARQYPEVTEDMKQRAVADGQSVDQFKDVILTAVRTHRANTPQAPAIHDGQAPVERAHIAAALCLRAGVSGDALIQRKDFDAKCVDMAQRYRRMSLHDVALEACRMSGQSLPRFADPDEVLARAASTADFTNILLNVSQKYLADRMARASATAPIWCREKSLKDFRASNIVSLTDMTDPRPLSPGGELLDMSIGDRRESIQAKTEGGIFGIKREDYINDDLGALTEIPGAMVERQLGRIDAEIYGSTRLGANTYEGPTMLEDSAHLFCTAHANIQGSSGRRWYLAAAQANAAFAIGYLNGKKAPTIQPIDETGRFLGKRFRMFFDFATAAIGWRGMVMGLGTLDATSLGAAITKLRRMTEKNGTPLNITPKFLIVAPEDEIGAEALITSTALATVTGENITLANTTTKNVFVKFGITIIPTPYLAAS